MYPRNKPLRLSMSVSVFCIFLAACGSGSGESSNLGNKSEVSKPSANNPTTNTSSNPTTNNPVANKRSSVITLETLKAFPTAMGAGAKVTGGRGGSVHWVTTTDPQGAGSFYEALSCGGIGATSNGNNKTIMFAVGGSFTHNYHCWTDMKKVTVAGQTAKDLGGFHLDNSGNNEHFFYASTENIIWRYISIRGNRVPPDYDGDPVLYTLKSGNIFDHITDYGGNSTSGPYKGVGNTVQYNLATEANNSNTQNTGYQTYNRDYREEAGFSDFLYNASILKSHRTPAVSGSKLNKFRVINNYNYGWGTRHMVLNGSPIVDTYNNVFEEEVEWASYHHTMGQTYSLYTSSAYADGAVNGSYYFNQNWHRKHDFSELFTVDNNNIEFQQEESFAAVNLRGNKLAASPYMVKLIDNPSKVKEYTLKNAGAGVRYGANGAVTNVYPWEVKYINYAKNGNESGTKESRYSRASIPEEKRTLTEFERKQGFPKSWANKHGLDVNDPNTRNSVKTNWSSIQGYTVINNAGYTNLEIYLAELAGDFHKIAGGN